MDETETRADRGNTSRVRADCPAAASSPQFREAVRLSPALYADFADAIHPDAAAKSSSTVPALSSAGCSGFPCRLRRSGTLSSSRRARFSDRMRRRFPAIGTVLADRSAARGGTAAIRAESRRTA